MTARTASPSFALGVRVDPKTTAWALVSGSNAAPILEDDGKLVPPKLYGEVETLVWYHHQIQTLIADHHPRVVAVRLAESFGAQGGRASDRVRARIEGSIMTAAALVGVRVFAGALQGIASALGTKGGSKKYLELDDLRGLDWGELDKKTREAVLVATAALEQRT